MRRMQSHGRIDAASQEQRTTVNDDIPDDTDKEPGNTRAPPNSRAMTTARRRSGVSSQLVGRVRRSATTSVWPWAGCQTRPVVRRRLVASILIVAVVGSALVITQPWSWCPTDWSNATRIDILGSSADVTVDGTVYRVGASALLDYMPRGFTSPFELWLYQISHAERHGLGINASISAISRDALGTTEFTCFRAIHANEVWARRPTTYQIQTAADGYPPGAPSPVPNEAWRQARASDGPEWPDGESVGLELWADIRGHHYIFAVPPFALMKGL